MFNYSCLKLFFYVAVISCLVSTSGYSQRRMFISPKVALDLSGNHSVSKKGQSGDLSVNTGFSVGLEVLSNKNEIFNVGGGLLYLSPREQEVKDSGKFNFIPIYAIGKLNLLTDQTIVPSLILNVGYNVIFNGDTKYKGPMSLTGGLLFGGGVRVSFNSFYFEGLFKSFSGSASYSNMDSNIEFDVTYTTLSFGLGLEI
jgi:hypothetical protein